MKDRRKLCIWDENIKVDLNKELSIWYIVLKEDEYTGEPLLTWH